MYVVFFPVRRDDLGRGEPLPFDPSSSSVEMPKISASFGSAPMSGQDWSFSHLLTACAGDAHQLRKGVLSQSQTLAVEDDPLSQCFFHILLISFSLNEVHGRAFCLAGRVSVVATAYIMP